MKNTILFVNAGHGGMDRLGNYYTPPSHGKKFRHATSGYHHNGWFYEGVFNRQMADLFITRARELGFLCIPTYAAIADIPHPKRITFANQHFRAYMEPSYWISFHSNASTNDGKPGVARGSCVFVHRNTTKENLWIASRTIASVNNIYEQYSGQRLMRDVWDTPLDETSSTLMPSMLFEIGFFDNRADADILMKEDFRLKVANSIAESLDERLT